MLVGCASAELTPEDVVGCYALHWRADDPQFAERRAPDSVYLTARRACAECADEVPGKEYAVLPAANAPDTATESGDGQILRPPWQMAYDRRWWKQDGDSLVVHFAGTMERWVLRLRFEGDTLRGEGDWSSDGGELPLVGLNAVRFECPASVEAQLAAEQGVAADTGPE